MDHLVATLTVIYAFQYRADFMACAVSVEFRKHFVENVFSNFFPKTEMTLCFVWLFCSPRLLDACLSF